MGARIPREQSRIHTSPNRLKFACFGFTANGGQTITTAEGTPTGEWEDTLRIARAAEAANFEAILPGARWAGFGGASNFQARSLETFAWAAAISAVTTRAQIFSTFHVPTAHPVRVAKTMATIDEISGGRFGLNIVAGWQPDEIGMFGVAQREHDTRYDYADEFFETLDAIFASDGYFDYESGEYFSLKNAYSEPKPVQAPRPVYMSAAMSPRGREFATRWADINFQVMIDLDQTKENITRTKKEAREKHGRDIKVAASAMIICADTEKEAQRYFEYYVDEKGDMVAADKLMEGLFPQTQDEHGNVRGMPAEMRAHMRRTMIAGHGAMPLIGTPEQIVEGFERIAATGLDLCTLGWVNFHEGIEQYVEQIHPLMVQAGLRVDEEAPAPVTLPEYANTAQRGGWPRRGGVDVAPLPRAGGADSRD